MSRTILFLVIGIVIGLVIGFIIGYVLFVPGLEFELQKLKNENQDLKNRVRQLNNTNSQLQQQLASLQQQVDNLTKIVELKMKKTIVSDKTVNIQPGRSYTYEFNTPYPGYIIITYTTTAFNYSTYIKVVTGDGIEFQPKTTVSGEEIKAVVPVLPPSTKIVFTQPLLLGSATVSFTIEYHY